jgi:ribosome-associated toxin RatA of RatAB toxin-antitoxin module
MASVQKSVIVPHSCATMFALVDDVERYTEFLPWCAATRVLERSPLATVARIDVDFHGLKTSFTTRNAKHPPHAMSLELVEGPFERFGGEWRFVPLGNDGCRVELSLDYAASGGALQALLGPVFGRIADTMVESFVDRAQELAGGRRT